MRRIHLADGMETGRTAGVNGTGSGIEQRHNGELRVEEDLQRPGKRVIAPSIRAEVVTD
jgi:hypothetical protein